MNRLAVIIPLAVAVAAVPCSAEEPSQVTGPQLTRAEVLRLYAAVAGGLEASGACSNVDCGPEAVAALERYTVALRNSLVWADVNPLPTNTPQE